MSNIAKKCSAGLVLLLTLAGCGGGGSSAPAEPAPSLQNLFAKASTATSAKHSAHYALDLTVSLETNGALKNALVQAFAANPIKLHLEGDASAKAFTADGSFSVTGRDFSGKLLAGPNELYAELLGTWYGTKHSGLGTLKRLGQSRLNTLPGAQKSSAQQLRQHADEIFDGTVSDGPTLDDAHTWEFKGTLDAAGIAKVDAENGQTLTAQQRDVLQSLQNATNVTVDIGKDDHLLRRADVSIDLNSDDLQKLQSSGSTLSTLKALHISFGADLSKWGESVTITPPDSYKPPPSLTSSLGLNL